MREPSVVVVEAARTTRAATPRVAGRVAISATWSQARRGGEAHGVSNLAAPALQHEMPSKNDSSARELLFAASDSTYRTETNSTAGREMAGSAAGEKTESFAADCTLALLAAAGVA